MFGLMKAKICSQPASAREARRLAYCGACKTLGARYGHRSRFLLSHDLVFLAELLEAMEGDSAHLPAAEGAFRSYNCLALPKDVHSVPMRLRFSAAATVFMAEAQLADHREDAPSRMVEATTRLLSTPFQKAAEDLEGWGVPVQELRALLATQTGRERLAAASGGRTPVEEVLRQVAGPTVEGTGILFGAGARATGQSASAEGLEILGREFGALIYLLDAYEDEPRDARRGEFNAFRAAFGATEKLTNGQRSAMRARVAEAGESVAASLRGLPMAAERHALFTARLRTNLAARLGTACSGSCACSATVQPTDRKVRAFAKAQDVVQATLAPSGPWVRVLLAPVVLLLALPLAFLFPVWVERDTRLGAACGLLLNLMFAGQAARRLIRPLRFAAEGPEDLEGLQEGAEEAAHQAKKSSGGGGCGDCGDCCDSCDCGDCCSSCDC